MADATITVTEVRRSVFGNVRIVISDVLFAGNYRTGGVALTPANLGLSTIDYLHVSPVAAADGGTASVGCKYDYSTGKLSMWELGGTGAAGDPLAEKTDNEAFAAASTTKIRVMAVGI